MIAKLKGLVDSVGTNWAILDVNGVGYQLFCDARTLSQLGNCDGVVSLCTETILRQDSLTLYGFLTQEDQDTFRLLTTVQGVGMKAALAILSVLSPAEITHAVVTQDKAMVSRADGVGPKLAGRIVSELKDKVGALSASISVTPGASGSNVHHHLAGISADALSALLNLGYKRADAQDAIANVMKDQPEMTLDGLIPETLKYLSNPAHRKVGQ